MALQLSRTVTCDWHAVLPESAKVAATAERLNPKGTLNDLCDPCAILFDLIFPRLDTLLPFIHPETLQQLITVGRPPTVAEKPQRAANQLTLPGRVAKSKPPSKVGKAKKTAVNGAWQEGVEQAICPEAHRAGSPKPYWVEVTKRGGHAKSSHHVYGPEIAYELQPGLTYTVFCTEHALCEKAGGFGFLDEHALQIHRNKCKHWETAPS